MGKLAEIVEVSDCRTISDVLNKSHTAWEPAAKPIAGIKEHPRQDGLTVVKDSGFHAIVRPDTMETLGICTKRYKPNSHVVHLAKLDNMVRHGDLVPERVSLWDAGRIMAFQFRAPVLDAEILSGDKVSPLLTLAFFNDGKHGDMSFFADFRWACTNQMGKVAMANEGKARAAHRGDVHANYEKILMERIDEMKKATAVRYTNMKRMARTSIGGKALLQYFGASLGYPEAAEELYQSASDTRLSAGARVVRDALGCYREDDCGAPASVWRAYNAVTRFLTHKAGRTQPARTRNALLGPSTATHFDKAYRDAVKLAA